MVHIVNLDDGNTTQISISSFLRGAGGNDKKNYMMELDDGGNGGDGGIRRRESPKEEKEGLGIFSFAPGNPFDKDGSDNEEEDEENGNGARNGNGNGNGNNDNENNNENDQDKDGFMNDIDNCFHLTYKQRFIGFICCMLGGIVLVLVGLLFLLSGDIGLFIACFSFGNILSLVSTMFLMGIVRQCKRMFKPIRMIATSVFLVCILLAIYFGMIEEDATLALVFGVLEILALVWYSLTYVPIVNRMISCGL